MRVGVIGAGITGLAITHYLAEHDVDVLTFEADAQPGGVIRSTCVDDRVLEAGPQRLRLTAGVRAIVSDLGLDEELVVAETDLPLYVYADGHLREVPTSIRAFLRTDLLGWGGKVRLLGEPFTDPIAVDERASDVFVRKFGREAYHRLFEPLFGGMYGSDPRSMPAAHALDRLMALEEADGSLLRAAIKRLVDDGDVPPPASFRDGLQTLPWALYERHRAYVHLDTPVTAVRPDPPEGYAIETSGRSTIVDRVVVTTPAKATAQILAPLPGFDPGPIAGLRYNSLVLVHLAASSGRPGYGYQVARQAGLDTLGVTWNASLFGRDDVHTAFFGGMWDPDAVERDDDTLAETAEAEFLQVMGVRPTVIDVTRLPRVMPAFDETWTDLARLDLPDDITVASTFTGHVGIPSRVREGESIANRLAEQRG